MLPNVTKCYHVNMLPNVTNTICYHITIYELVTCKLPTSAIRYSIAAKLFTYRECFKLLEMLPMFQHCRFMSPTTSLRFQTISKLLVHCADNMWRPYNVHCYQVLPTTFISYQVTSKLPTSAISYSIADKLYNYRECFKLLEMLPMFQHCLFMLPTTSLSY